MICDLKKKKICGLNQACRAWHLTLRRHLTFQRHLEQQDVIASQANTGPSILQKAGHTV
jgi:hypothetical protein